MDTERERPPSSSILIVDDDPDIIQALSDLLEHEGYPVQTAGRGEQALALGKAQRFGAVILDLMLPDLDGLSVLKGLKEIDPKVPVIILTAYPASDKKDAAFKDGAHAYLIKPYNRDELKAILSQAIGVKTLTMRAEKVEYALGESEERFRSIVESATDAIILADDRGHIVSWNTAASTLFLYSKEEVVGKPLTMLMPERYRGAHLKALQNLQSTGKPRLIGKTLELHGVKKDGTEFPLELSLGTWMTETDRCFSGFIRDITERKRAEEQLRTSEERLDHAVQGSTDGLWDARPLPGEPWYVPHTPVWYSRQFKAMLGFSDEEFPEKLESWSSRLHPEDKDRVFGALFAHIDWKEPYDVEYRLYTKHECRWFRARGQATWDETGKVVRMAGSIQCVTDRKLAETALRESEERLRLSLAAANLGTWDWQVQTGEVIWSENVEALFGLQPGSFAGTYEAYLALIHSEDRDIVARALTRVLEEDVDYDIEHRTIWPDGSIHWMACKGRVFRDDTAKVVRMLGTVQDITKRKQTEDVLRESQERFRQLAENIREVFWLTNPEKDRMIYISPGYEDIWGRTCESLYASPRDWLEAILPEDRDKVLQAALTKQAVGEYSVEYRILRPDGTIRWIRDRAFPIRDQSGHVYRVAGLAEDITESRKAE